MPVKAISMPWHCVCLIVSLGYLKGIDEMSGRMQSSLSSLSREVRSHRRQRSWKPVEECPTQAPMAFIVVEHRLRPYWPALLPFNTAKDRRDLWA